MSTNIFYLNTRSNNSPSLISSSNSIILTNRNIQISTCINSLISIIQRYNFQTLISKISCRSKMNSYITSSRMSRRKCRKMTSWYMSPNWKSTWYFYRLSNIRKHNKKQILFILWQLCRHIFFNNMLKPLLNLISMLFL